MAASRPILRLPGFVDDIRISFSQLREKLGHGYGGLASFGAAVEFLAKAALFRLLFVIEEQDLINDRHLGGDRDFLQCLKHPRMTTPRARITSTLV